MMKAIASWEETSSGAVCRDSSAAQQQMREALNRKQSYCCERRQVDVFEQFTFDVGLVSKPLGTKLDVFVRLEEPRLDQMKGRPHPTPPPKPEWLLKHILELRKAGQEKNSDAPQHMGFDDDPTSDVHALNVKKREDLAGEPTSREPAASANELIIQSSKSLQWPETNCFDDRRSISTTQSDTTMADEDSEVESDELDSDELAKRTKKRQKQYFIARELTTTEEVFVDNLRLLNVDFRAVAAAHLPKEIVDQLLPYLPQLQTLNEQLLAEFRARLEEYHEKRKIADVLATVGPFLKQYSMFMKDFASLTATHDDVARRFPAFASALKDFEASPRCCKMSVKHYLLSPVQRIPRYRLLLEDYLRNLECDHPDFKDATQALKIISVVAEHANATVRDGDNFIKLLAIQNNLLVSRVLIRPGRQLLKEGDLFKLSRKEPQMRRFVLCSDCLLYLTVVQQGTFRLNHEIPLTGMRVSKPQAADNFQNELQIISSTRSFTLVASSTEERDEWFDALEDSIATNASRRSTFATMSRTSTLAGSAPSLAVTSHSSELGEEAPVWVPDRRVTMCQLCTSEFTVTFRRHHCRCCGRVVCADCSGNKAPLKYRRFRVARVCQVCFDKLQEVFFSKQANVKKRLSSTFYADLGAEANGNSASSGEIDSEAENEHRVSSGAPEDAEPDYALLMTQFQRSVSVGIRASGRRKVVPKVLKEVTAHDVSSTISGYLQLRRKKNVWDLFWFVIKGRVLFKFKASEDIAALTSTPLLGWKVTSPDASIDGTAKDLIFQLSHPGQPYLIFKADSEPVCHKWLNAILEALVLE